MAPSDMFSRKVGATLYARYRLDDAFLRASNIFVKKCVTPLGLLGFSLSESPSKWTLFVLQPKNRCEHSSPH